ncbi:MAG: GNAT family N-acetyltransferase [Deferrisomatales bacterium]|nr:GNAT family N-acetyltransferase [Deferrisomatales bacterium]
MTDAPEQPGARYHPSGEEDRPEIEIREMEIDDLAGVFHMGERTFTADIPNLYRTWDEYEVTHLFTTEPELCLVAEDTDADRLAGFAMATTVDKARSSWKYGYLLWMAVDLGYRRYRVGRRLFRNMRSRMLEQDVRILMVDTAAENQRAIAFFKGLGFDQPRKHLYMSLNLDPSRKKGGRSP